VPASRDSGWELTEHTADVGLHAWGPDPSAVFEQAARGLLSLLVDPAGVVARETYTVVAETPAEGLDAVLVAFLNELLFRIETDGIVPADVVIVDLTETSVAARVAGEPVDPGRHRLHLGVKAATLHGLWLGRSGPGWEATVVLDV